MKPDLITKLFRLNIALAFIEGLFVLWQYLRIPSESGVAVLMGFSLLRLIILCSVLLAVLAFGFLFALSLRALWWEQRWKRAVIQVFERTGVFWLLLLICFSIYIFLFSSEHYLGSLVIHRTRLTPALVWAMLVSFQGLISFLFLRAYDFSIVEKYRGVFAASVLAFISVGVLILFIAWTRIGLTPDAVYWQEAGVPLLFSQILFIVIISSLIYALFSKMDVVAHKRTDVIIFIVIWLTAFALWQSQPVSAAYNIIGPTAPNFQGYPFGDAMLYDVTAQGFLIGKPIPADFWAKPLYSFFLSILHLLARQNFNLLVTLQVASLAFIPALIYLLTKILGGRLSGIVAALLVILRERNGIGLSNVIQVSHSKLLLSDVFAMGGMVLLVWLLLCWLEKPTARRAVPVAVGGAMGLLILVRGHPVLIVPFLFLIALIFTRYDVRLLREGAWKLALGLLLVMVPWFWHTYDLTGRFAFQDNTSSFAQKDSFVQTYSGTPNANTGSYEQFESQVMQQVILNPRGIAQFVSAHYFHNTVFSYLLLPQSFQIESLRSYVKSQPFWGRWNGGFSVQAWLLMFINVSILALGLGVAWKRTKGLVFVPLTVGAAYNLSVAVSRRSGWRFILPADWITLVFYAIGIAQLIMLVYALLRRSAESTVSYSEPAAPGLMERSSLAAGLPFLLIAVVLVTGHKIFPAPQPAKDTREMVQMVQDASQGDSGITPSQLEQFMQNENATIVYGEALYPVYFKADEGALNYSWLSFSSRPYARLIFYMIGAQSSGVVLSMETKSLILPDGANVIVLGCKTENGDIDALSVLVTSTDPPVLYYREPFPELTCPYPE